MVEKIIELAAELHLKSLRQFERFVKARVHVPKAGLLEGVTTGHGRREVALRRVRSEGRASGEFTASDQRIDIRNRGRIAQVVKIVASLISAAFVIRHRARQESARDVAKCGVVGIVNSQRITGPSGENWSKRPATCYFFEDAFAVAGDGYIPQRTDHHALPHVEIRAAI